MRAQVPVFMLYAATTGLSLGINCTQSISECFMTHNVISTSPCTNHHISTILTQNSCCTWMQKQRAGTAAQHALYASHTSRKAKGKQQLRCEGVIGRRIKLQALLDSVPKLVSNLGPSAEDAHHAAVGITTTDLVSKSAAIEVNASSPVLPKVA